MKRRRLVVDCRQARDDGSSFMARWAHDRCGRWHRLAVAEDIYGRGGAVIATAENKKQVEDLAVGHDDARRQAVELDVTSAYDFSAVVDSTVARSGRLDGVVSNAGLL